MRGYGRGFVFTLTLLSVGLCMPAQQAVAAASRLQTADALLAEAEMIDGRQLRRAMINRAAALYVDYAHEAGGTKGAEALMKAAALYVDLGGAEAIANALACTTMIALRPDAISVAPEALLLQARIYRDQREWGRSVRAAMSCADRFPRSSQAPTALFKAGQIMESNIRNAAEADILYTRLVETYPDNPLADQALFARASVRAGQDRHEAAIADYLALVKAYPKSDLADQAMHAAIRIYDRDLKDFVKAHELAVTFRETFPESSLLRRVSRIESKNLRYVRDAGP